jgi:Response regulator containing a CheY-like receiver domain and an HTH DNA-binding domain
MSHRAVAATATHLLSATPLLTEFTDRVSERDTPAGVLDALNDLASRCGHLSVLGAARFPLKPSDWRSTQLDKDVFLHSSAPEGWWDEYAAMAKHEPDLGMMMAKSSLMSRTWTETMNMLDPIGVDRWSHDLAFKYGMRDGLTCSVGRRWLVVYWSPKVLTQALTQPKRIILFAAASFAALRLEQLTNHDRRWPEKAPITPRELAVLRLVAMGKRTDEIAKLLGLGEETVRSHLKKVQSKLGVRNRAQAAVEAVRQQLIP